MKKIILASKSPRRRELLDSIGLKFEIKDSNFDESKVRFTDNAGEFTEALAYGKAKGVSDKIDEGIVLGADTVVVLGNKIYGKPKDSKEAFEMLCSLNNKAHDVITGVAMIDSSTGRVLVEHDVTKVMFNDLTNDEIMAYIKSGDYIGKAGAYGIQSKGAVLIKRIEGCYFNVVGLPLGKVCNMLKSLDEDVYTHWS